MERATRAAQAQQTLAHGMAVSFGVAAIFDACALLVIMVTIRDRRAATRPAPRLAAITEEAAD